jgi:hypothetical protein
MSMKNSQEAGLRRALLLIIIGSILCLTTNKVDQAVAPQIPQKVIDLVAAGRMARSLSQSSSSIRRIGRG